MEVRPRSRVREKGVAQTKDAYEKFKAVARRERAIARPSIRPPPRARATRLKVIEMTRANTNAMFDFTESCRREVAVGVRRAFRPSMRALQFETSPAGQGARGLAQKGSRRRTAEPIKSGVSKAMKRSPNGKHSQ